VLIDADTVGQPSPAAPTLSGEGLPSDQTQRRLQICEAIGSARAWPRARSRRKRSMSAKTPTNW